MAIHKVATLKLYRDLLQNSSQEIDLLFNEILIGVTSFFRDPAAWTTLADEVLPELLANRTNTDELRAWVIGCSTGEEAYSLGMVFAEAAGRHPRPGRPRRLQGFASDLSSDAIATARRGQYPPAIAEAVSAGLRLKRFSADRRRVLSDRRRHSRYGPVLLTTMWCSTRPSPSWREPPRLPQPTDLLRTPGSAA
ncbi:MAG: CheR family methyltransferase [Gammaproteobacteria bacterium]|nr:CheR family methyltransferase [Gammaproteobacteria bacterium]